MDPQETGMQVCDSDGGELPDRASGSCHTGLISPATHHEGRPVTRPLFPTGYEDRQVGVGVTRTRGCQEGKKTQGQDVMWRHHPWFCTAQTAVDAVWWTGVHIACRRCRESVCVCMVLREPRAARPKFSAIFAPSVFSLVLPKDKSLRFEFRAQIIHQDSGRKAQGNTVLATEIRWLTLVSVHPHT